MRLERPHRRAAGISLTPLVDVMMILLVFFMVTSTFLDLDMIPVVKNAPDEAGAPAPAPAQAAPGGAMLIRIAAGGQVFLRGRPLGPAELSAAIAARVAAQADAPVLVLPSGEASAQALVTVLEAATRAGAANLSIVRLEAR